MNSQRAQSHPSCVTSEPLSLRVFQTAIAAIADWGRFGSPREVAGIAFGGVLSCLPFGRGARQRLYRAWTAFWWSLECNHRMDPAGRWTVGLLEHDGLRIPATKQGRCRIGKNATHHRRRMIGSDPNGTNGKVRADQRIVACEANVLDPQRASRPRATAVTPPATLP
jgi:hypothetical protein